MFIVADAKSSLLLQVFTLVFCYLKFNCNSCKLLFYHHIVRFLFELQLCRDFIHPILTFFDLLDGGHDVVPGVLLVPLPLEPLRGDVAGDAVQLHLLAVLLRVLVKAGVAAGLPLPVLGGLCAGDEGREVHLLVAAGAAGHLGPVPGPGAQLLPLVVSVTKQVVSAGEEPG